MTESGGRRIKRSVLVDLHSIKFCDDEMLQRFGTIKLLEQYLENKEVEIEAYNKDLQLDQDEMLINRRCQTNIGVFRAYVIAYLSNNPKINQEMTFLVRQLPPGEHGLPLEIYVFCSDKRWAYYEEVQADIFDHLFAALPVFDLRSFQNPSGYDLRSMSTKGEVYLRADS